MNAIMVTGRLTRDPEGSTTKSGTTACRGGIAIDTYKVTDATALFIDYNCLGQNAEYTLRYLRKGDTVGITGKLDYYTFTDSEAKQRKNYYIQVQRIECIKHKNAQGEETTESPVTQAPTQARENRAKREAKEAQSPEADISDDDMPF